MNFFPKRPSTRNVYNPGFADFLCLLFLLHFNFYLQPTGTFYPARSCQQGCGPRVDAKIKLGPGPAQPCCNKALRVYGIQMWLRRP